MCSTMAGPTPGSGRAAPIIPSCRLRFPSRPASGRRLLGEDRNALLAALETVTIQNGLSSAHITFLHDDERQGGRGARLAAPGRASVSLVQPRLCQLRRFPRPAFEPQAQGDPQGAGGGGRGAGDLALRGAEIEPAPLGRDVGLLPAYRRAQMGPALSDPRFLRPGRRGDGRIGADVPGARPAAGRSPARSTSSAPTRSTAAIGARSRNGPSSISS